MNEDGYVVRPKLLGIYHEDELIATVEYKGQCCHVALRSEIPTYEDDWKKFANAVRKAIKQMDGGERNDFDDRYARRRVEVLR